MVLLPPWSCPQVEVGVRVPRLPSRDLQVSSLRNTINRTAEPSTLSDVRSPLVWLTQPSHVFEVPDPLSML